MTELLGLLKQIRWHDLADIALVSFVVYKVIMLLKGTRAMQMLFGLGIIFICMVIIQELNLITANWIINSFLSSIVLVVIVLFQSDLRRALARVGRGPLWPGGDDSRSTLEEVGRASVTLASRMTGAIIVLERRIGLGDYVEGGVALNAEVSRELLVSLFQTTGPLHDGAVIIRGKTVLAARCVLPLTTSKVGRNLGTRHRAALGLSEQTDAVCVVVSEERGRVSVAVRGKLTQDLDAKALQRLLSQLFDAGKRRGRWLLAKESSGA